MIQVSELKKSFDDFMALDGLNLNVKKGSIYGLIGVNGSGKTTLIKHLTGVYRPDQGQIAMDGCPVYENLALKRRIGYIPDDLYFFNAYNLKEAAGLYRSLYPQWSEERFSELTKHFKLDLKRKISRFSKGMQKQAAFALNLSLCPDFLILDEPVDGLDPIIRRLVWKYIIADVAERQMTVLISSHNLKELEGICDCIGILSNGKIMIERDLDELKSDIHKIQVAFGEPCGDDFFRDLNILHRETTGSLELLIARGTKQSVEGFIHSRDPILFDILPLTLEEIFIYELGGENSELKDILF